MRLAHKVDGNQAEIVNALRRAGCSVAVTSSVGKGYPDLTVGRAEQTYLIEVKRPGERLTPDESAWHDAWHGHVAIVHDIDEALAAVGLL